jgi:hypothetical protein
VGILLTSIGIGGGAFVVSSVAPESAPAPGVSARGLLDGVALILRSRKERELGYRLACSR